MWKEQEKVQVLGPRGSSVSASRVLPHAGEGQTEPQVLAAFPLFPREELLVQFSAGRSDFAE